MDQITLILMDMSGVHVRGRLYNERKAGVKLPIGAEGGQMTVQVHAMVVAPIRV